VSGFPAIDHLAWLKAASTFEHLPEMRKTLKKLSGRMNPDD
jgi:UDP-3-O-[3-hydroxymyristoyl] glucosamine N-acyltransferase